MQHRISAGALVLRDNHLLLLRHFKPGRYDFWAPPGGGVESSEMLEAAAERETFEETALRVKARSLAYFEEVWGPDKRTVKFCFLADYLLGDIDLSNTPAR